MTDPFDLDAFGATFRDFLDRIVYQAPPRESLIATRLREHLGHDPVQLPIVELSLQMAEQANLQTAMDVYLGSPERSAELVGVGGPQKSFTGMSLGDLVAKGHDRLVGLGPIEHRELPSGYDTTITCVHWGLYLIDDGGQPLAVLVRAGREHGVRSRLGVDVLARSAEHATAFLDELRELMAAHNIYRGKVVSLGQSFEGGPFTELGVTFHQLDDLTADDVVLEDGTLERIERHTVGFGRHAERLAAAGRHLRRGLLLYGPPGTGKTHTIAYLAGQLPDRTVLILTGADQALVSASFELARKLTPSMVVLEDVDLIAEERTMPGTPGRLPLLFTLMNELDGLEADADVIAVLTTNRPDLVEPALAARPGRIDLAIEIPLPDASCRRRLFELYGRGLSLQLDRLDDLVERTDGLSAAFIKELLRHAALLAADECDGLLAVNDAHVEAALDELVALRARLAATLPRGAAQASS